MKKKPKPPRSILDPTFKYVDAANTNVAATFRRLKREAKANAALETEAQIEARAKVRSLLDHKVAK